MRKNRGFVALASAIALVAALFGGVSTALAKTAAVPQVNKQLELNPGSTVTATFTYTITPTELSTGTGSEKTYTDGPAATIDDIALNNASSDANNNGTGAIKFGGETDASAFAHAGVYAWTIRENATANGSGIGAFQDDAQAYTLIATVVNGDNGLEFSSFEIVRGEATSVTNTNKTDKIAFDNKYTETTLENGADLTITKVVAGNQGDKSKQFEFTVTFAAPSVLPKGQTAAQALNAITATANGATDIQFADAADGATTRTITFKAADAKGVTFSNVLVGTTYSVQEAAVDGYKQSWTATSNGVESASQASLLIGENANNGTMTNTHEDVTPTGLIINNMPFIMLGCVAVAGVAAYGAAKRKLEK
ncbi:MAG: hypothetical protein MSA61_02365 [Coriobacteriaceae bacterium]|uniref:DUF7601 domain-containing protein n=1 Tax=Tractidigestivibacter sp. TaxID=2847320 RepID=UPI002A82E202|nr:hypothetical protein [Tractidigestivibacter sp.]MCI6274330.1 hypothetical protein [Coriobacteriaceae bacterium]MCI7438054.1 hypothetical protein [Coriobacteriaceae bacterium]MDY4535139.1 hypothetical protein [Tractidigestivibacter sp.]